MWWPFRKKQSKPEPESIVQEHWETNFAGGKDIPFSEEEEDTYRSRITKDGLLLFLKRKNIFAWTLSRPYRYRNFVLTVEIELSPENGYASAGVVFRYANDGTYYYVMVSSEGMFRFDVVFNSTPRTLIPWTSYEQNAEKKNTITLTVSAHRTFFTLFINDVWVGEVDDETVDTGYIGAAGQNYHEKSSAAFLFHSVEVESRDPQVEDFYDTRVKGGKIPWKNRKTLARRFFDTGQYSAALIQLRKSFAARRPEQDDYLFEARIYNFLNLEEDALRAVESCFPDGADNKEVILEKAGILYRMNRFLQLKEFLKAFTAVWEAEPLGWNLLGNAEDALGNFEASGICYEQAATLDNGNGIYRLNAARACEKTGKPERAVELLKEAASIFFNMEDFDTLQHVLSHLERLAPNDPVLEIYKGKLLFHDGKTGDAFRIFQRLRDRGAADSSVDFLYALICADRGDRERADTIFARVVEEEPGYYLYWFRYTENLYLLGKDSSFALQKALEYNDSDPWVQNLAGLIALDADDLEEALLFFKRAFETDPSLSEVRINYAEALMRAGKTDEAFALVEDDEDPEVVNQRGNLLVKAGKFEDAVRAYSRARAIDPGKRIYEENYADILIKLDRLLEAEEIIARLLTEKNEPSLLWKIAFIAERKGEFRRAEMAYQEALKLDPEDASVKTAYTRFLISRHDYKKAQELLDRIPDSYNKEQKEALQEEIRTATMDRYECSICHHEWWVPKVLPETGTLKLFGEPHPDSPAGKCPSCGKVYCVSCAMESIKDNHFTCRDCGEPLKLSENYLRYLASEFAKDE